MASVSSLSLCFLSPRAQARTNKPRKQLNTKKSGNNNLNTIRTAPPRPPLSSVSGGLATTYTRLPPKDDEAFVLPESYTEIKLSDFAPRTRRPNKSFSGSEDKIEDNEEEEEEITRNEEDSRFDYGKFELFEVNSDDETDGDEYREDESGFENEGGEEEDREKEKGVPAVMRCFDRAKIYVRSGDGGNGVVAFRREKFVPLGGPSGGDGGRGGNVYMEVDGSMNSLLPFRNSIHFRAGRGSHGQGSKMNGAKGEDVVVKVPAGTVVRAAGKDGIPGDVLLELLHTGDRALLLPGGRGGRGNASFKSGTNKVPRIAENGEEGPEM